MNIEINSPIRLKNLKNSKFNDYFGTVLSIQKNGKYKIKVHPYRHDTNTYYMTVFLKNLNLTNSYMRWCTNNGELLEKYKDTEYDSAVCIYCGWNDCNIVDIYNGPSSHTRRGLDTTDESTLLCPMCKVDALVVGIHSLEEYKSWYIEGFNTGKNPFDLISSIDELDKLNSFLINDN